MARGKRQGAKGKGKKGKHHFRRDHGDVSDYDLVLNSATFSLEQMADLVLIAYETKVGKKPPEAGHVATP